MNKKQYSRISRERLAVDKVCVVHGQRAMGISTNRFRFGMHFISHEPLSQRMFFWNFHCAFICENGCCRSRWPHEIFFPSIEIFVVLP